MNAKKLAKIFAYAVLAGGALLDTAAPALAATETTPAANPTATTATAATQADAHVEQAGRIHDPNNAPQPPPNCVDDCWLHPGMHRHPWHWPETSFQQNQSGSQTTIVQPASNTGVPTGYYCASPMGATRCWSNDDPAQTPHAGPGGFRSNST